METLARAAVELNMIDAAIARCNELIRQEQIILAAAGEKTDQREDGERLLANLRQSLVELQRLRTFVQREVNGLFQGKFRSRLMTPPS